MKTAPRLVLKEICEIGRFNKHCRAFDNKLQELSMQFKKVREQVVELHRDVALLNKSSTQSVELRYENISKDNHLLEYKLEQQHLELEKLKAIFDALWEEELCRIHLEKEVFHSQVIELKLKEKYGRKTNFSFYFR